MYSRFPKCLAILAKILLITFIIAVKFESYSTGHQVHKNGISTNFKLIRPLIQNFFLKLSHFGPLLCVEDFEVAKVKIFIE